MSYPKKVKIAATRLPEVRLRDAFAAAVHRSIADPQASLGLGFLLGQRSALPSDLMDTFKLLGLTHIVVASGYNLTVLVRLARRAFERISKFQTSAVSLALMVGFVMVTGFSASMTRAALVTGLAVWAWHYGRKIHPVLLLVFSAAVTGLWNPFYVWNDAGWYLPFLAFGGVLLLAPVVTYRLYGEKDPPMLVQLVIETLCAQATTLPLLLYLFGSLPILSLAANVLVVPFIPLAMLLTFFSGVGALVVPAGAIVWGLPASLLLDYIVTLSNALASVPWARADISFSAPAMVACYAIIVSFLVMLHYRIGYDFLRRAVID